MQININYSLIKNKKLRIKRLKFEVIEEIKHIIIY